MIFRALTMLIGVTALVMFSAIFVAIVRPGGADLTPLLTLGRWIVAAVFGLFVVQGLLFWNGAQIVIGDKANWLHGATLELIKAMENSGPGGAEARAAKSEATTERFAVMGTAAARAGKEGPPLHSAPGPMGFGMPPSEVDLKLTDAGLTLAEIYREDAKGFRRSRGAVRTAALIFVTIVQHGNIMAARTMMIEHMKAQRADAARSLPNWTNLKLFLDLPHEWPGGDIPEQEQKAGRTLPQVLTANWALGRIRPRLFHEMAYRTPTGMLVAGDDILKAIREFTRTDNTEQAFS